MNLNLRFTISWKLIIGFGILLLITIITNFLIYKTLNDNLNQNLGVITEVYTPSSAHLNDLFWLVTQTKILIKNWVYIERKDDTPDKNRLQELHSRQIPETEAALEPLVEKWDEKEQEQYRDVVESIDSLVQMHQEIMGELNSFEKYEDMMVTFPIYIKTEEDGDVMVLTKRIKDKLEHLINHQEKIIDETNKTMRNSFTSLQRLILIMALLMIISVLLIGYITRQALVNPINSIKKVIQDMGKGVLPRKEIKVSTDEIGEMSEALNLLVNGLKKTSEFSLKIGEGDFKSSFQPLSKYDVLGNSLILMRQNLKKAAEDEANRKQEDSQRSWAAQGLAKFGEILRVKADDMEEFSFRLISNLVKYLDANVGGFYIINDDNPEDVYVELMACYAYGRQKYLKKRIDFGVNIIGQCVQEKETIFLTDIPLEYIKITSGLGADTPRSLLIVPLKINEIVFGVVEVGSFNVFKKYQIEFIEKLGESIASTISTVKINISTAKLLAESQEKSERLAQQDEIVRQNIEEMQAAHDEMRQQIKEERQKNAKLSQKYKEKIQGIEIKLKKQQDKLTKQEISLRGNLDAINNTLGAIEYNMQGEVLAINERFTEISGLEIDSILNRQQTQFMLKERSRSEQFKNLWNDLNKGVSRMIENQYFFDGKEMWLKETYTPVKDEDSNFYRVITLVSDITEKKLQEEEENKENNANSSKKS
ncbi:MAG: histidine kinase [Bacteroidia bacterium]|nr:MAG: histidine kinase [Bacteroidia bacterium]